MTGASIAITGASGAIGSRLCRAAHASGLNVGALSRTRPADLPDRVPWHPLDLAQADLPRDALTGVDTVIHLASVISGETPDRETANDLWRVNVLGTRTLITAMAQAGVPRLVLASTANFYAPGLAEADERSPVAPTSRTLYLGSKAVQEWTAASLCRELGISFASLRISSVVGTGRSVIDNFAQRLSSGEQVRIANQGTFGADFVDVDDVVNGLLLAAGQSLDGIWNLASGERRLLGEVAADLALFAGKDASNQIVIDKHGDPDHGFPAINCDKLKAAGYRPTPYPDMLSKVLARVPTMVSTKAGGALR